MRTITVIYTKRAWNPVSYVIRWCLPRTRFAVAESSHCLIEDGDYLIEASMSYGVCRRIKEEAMAGLTVVTTVSYVVPDAEAGLEWARKQVGSGYDLKGAIGLLEPDREWAELGSWFCYELAAATLEQAGRVTFRSIGHITGSMLLTLHP